MIMILLLPIIVSQLILIVTILGDHDAEPHQRPPARWPDRQ